MAQAIRVLGACENNLKNIDVDIPRGKITVVTGVSGSGKSTLIFDTVLREAQRRFFHTLSHYTRQFLDLGSRPLVRKVQGLSPAIALEQNETIPSSKTTVGSVTDLTELIGVLFANYGQRTCPDHGLSNEPVSKRKLQATLVNRFQGQMIALAAPIAEQKKGAFNPQLTAIIQKGFLRIFIDGQVVKLNQVPELDKNSKHTIKVIVDCFKLGPDSLERLSRGIGTCFEEGGGYAEVFSMLGRDELDLASKASFSAHGGCPECGFSWPQLDSRYFNPNSLGACQACSGEEGSCDSCNGTGLDRRYQAIKILDFSANDLHDGDLDQLSKIVAEMTPILVDSSPAAGLVLQQISGKINSLLGQGLGYLNSARRFNSMSGGEQQRLRLANILGEKLRGVLYILDEPSQGLHPQEIGRITATLKDLRQMGSTVVVVDHDLQLIAEADWVIDMGPGGGTQGGSIVAAFSPSDAEKFAGQSQTARLLVEDAAPGRSSHSKEAGSFFLRNLSYRNLQIDQVQFRIGAINTITGVSGAGKSTLLFDCLLPLVQGEKRPPICGELELTRPFDQVLVATRTPTGRSHYSMPVTFLDLFGDIRNLYATLPSAQILGLTSRSFSLQVGEARCDHCGGKGIVTLSLKFLADQQVCCSVCQGARYKHYMDGISYRGRSIKQLLAMTLDDAAKFFENHPKILRKLEPAIEIGLGYLKLGQPTSTLSGGEVQRLKLVPLLGRRTKSNNLLILDEPTRGLHDSDCMKLISVLDRLVESGTTVIIVEHSATMIQASDWIIDLGPGSSRAGGRLVYNGPADGVASCPISVTGKFLAAIPSFATSKKTAATAQVVDE